MTAVVTAVHFIAIGMGANLVEFGPALALLLAKSLSGAATVAIVGFKLYGDQVRERCAC